MSKKVTSYRAERLRGISVALTVMSFWCQALLCVGSELDEVRNSASLMPGRVRSYQFSARFEGKEDDPKRNPTANSTKFYQSGGSFRVESDAVDRPGIKVNPLARSTLFAYNGSRYQWFMAGRETLTFSSQCRHPNLYWLPNPVTLPYLWLAGPKGNWSDIKDKNVWIRRFEAARYEGEQVEKGVTFSVVSMPLDQESGVVVRIYFARDHGYYPLKFVEYKDTLPWVTTEVTRFTTVEADGGNVIFPLDIGTRIEPPGGGQMNWKLSDVSIKVNHSIDEALFTLSPSIAKTVIDYDKDLKKMVQRPLGAHTPQRSPWRGRLIIINCTALILLIGCFVYRHIRRWNNAKTQ